MAKNYEFKKKDFLRKTLGWGVIIWNVNIDGAFQKSIYGTKGLVSIDIMK